MVDEGLLATKIARGGGSGGGGEFSYQRYMVGAAGRQYLQDHRAVPMEVLMNRQASRTKERDTGLTSAIVPTFKSVNISKMFRIQLQFSPPFSSFAAVTSATACSSKGNGSSANTATRAIVAYQSSGREVNNGPSTLALTSGALSSTSAEESGKKVEHSLYDTETLSQLESRLRRARGDMGAALKLKPYKYESSNKLDNFRTNVNSLTL